MPSTLQNLIGDRLLLLDGAIRSILENWSNRTCKSIDYRASTISHCVEDDSAFSRILRQELCFFIFLILQTCVLPNIAMLFDQICAINSTLHMLIRLREHTDGHLVFEGYRTIEVNTKTCHCLPLSLIL